MSRTVMDVKDGENGNFSNLGVVVGKDVSSEQPVEGSIVVLPTFVN